MKKIIFILSLLGIIIISAIGFLKDKTHEPTKLDELIEKYPQTHTPSANHAEFAILKQYFSSPQQVTAACNSCHTEEHKQVMQSNHWNWTREEYIKGRGIVSIGKMNAINNFCIGVEGNEESCAKCHIGFGMTSSMFSFTDPTNIDCLVCHDQSETYAKAPEKGGAPVANIDLNLVAQSVGRPTRANCGVCHFYGGGGNNVKHGDLEESMFEPTRDVDVHMAADGVNLSCVDCHTTEKHLIKGKMYSLSSMNRNRSECEQCHTTSPHESTILNEHTYKVACQTCHIPIYAKVNSTKLYWDWSTAGKLKDGKPYSEEDSLGNHTYLSIKGSFVWGRQLKPEYIWFNGTADHYLLGDTISDTTKPLKINTLNGSYSDENSKIYPVKVHRAIQPFDPVNSILIQPKLFANEKGEGAFWQDFDWRRSSEAGMKEVHLPFSGKTSFIKTEMTWPLNHMVSTKDLSVSCTECHTRNNSRLAQLTDFYMPGRDYSKIVDTAGIGVILMTLFGVFVHGAVRIVSSKKRKKNQHE